MKHFIRNNQAAIAVEYLFVMPLLLYLGFLLIDIGVVVINNLTANRIAEKIALEVSRIVSNELEPSYIENTPGAVFIKKIIQDQGLCVKSATESQRKIIFSMPVDEDILLTNAYFSSFINYYSTELCTSSGGSVNNLMIIFPQGDFLFLKGSTQIGTLNGVNLNSIQGIENVNLTAVMNSREVMQDLQSKGLPLDEIVLKGLPMPFGIIVSYTTPFKMFTSPILCRLNQCNAKNNIVVLVKKNSN